MIRLLYRFFEPNSGEIFIGGQDIAKLDLQSLRRAIAVVPQVNHFKLCIFEILFSCFIFKIQIV